MEGGTIMQEAVVLPLAAWQNFYVIIGSAAATLTGLTFIMVTLVAGTGAPRTSESVAAFGTPTVVHFGFALFIAALFTAPWQALWQVSLLLGLCGLAGVTYGIIVVRRALRQSAYQPVLEDWLWHAIFPLVSYTTFLVAAIILPANPFPALLGVGAATILLLFIGIHNTWDSVTYVLIERARLEKEKQD
jgi:hypothetical protein